MKGTKVYLPIDGWSDISIQHVDKVPYDIDGKQVYQLKYDPENRMASSLDGRQWQKYYESRRKDFDGLRRLAKCKGSRKCVNDQCSYLREFGEIVTILKEISATTAKLQENSYCVMQGKCGNFHMM